MLFIVTSSNLVILIITVEYFTITNDFFFKMTTEINYFSSETLYLFTGFISI